jgi:hypothetical protein
VISRLSMHAPRALPHESSEVLWLGLDKPPQQLVLHLRGRGFALCPPEPNRARPPARLLALEASTAPLAPSASLAGRRLAMVHPDPGAADAVAQALRAKGAEVVILSLNPGSLDRALVLGPHAVLMESGDFYGACWELVRALWQHPRLAFTPILLSRLEGRGLDDFSALDTQELCRALDALGAEHDRIARQAREQAEFSIDLSAIGPARTLRVLVESGRSLRASFECPAARVEVDLTEHVVVGAHAEGAPDCLGPYALALLLQQRTGTVHVRRVERPAVTNIIAPLDTALDAADHSTERARPTLTPPSVSGVRVVSAPREVELPTPAPPAPPAPPAAPAPRPLAVALPAPAPAVLSAPAPARAAAVPALAPPPPPAAPVVAPPEPVPVAPAPQAFVPTEVTGEADALLPVSSRRALTRKLAMAALVVVACALFAVTRKGETVVVSAGRPALASAPVVPAPIEVAPAAPPPASSSEPARPEPLADSARERARQASKLVSQGHSFRRAGLYGSARTRYERALEVYPNYPRALAGLAKVSLAQGKSDDALEYAERLRRARPGDAHHRKLVSEVQRATQPAKKPEPTLRRGSRAKLSP